MICDRPSIYSPATDMIASIYFTNRYNTSRPATIRVLPVIDLGGGDGVWDYYPTPDDLICVKCKGTGRRYAMIYLPT